MQIQMGKKKTSINIDEQLWSEWLVFVIKKYGTSRKVSEALADAIRQYMKQTA
jgi:metal-responsive CopG/Arc/MetJ family transcriptional regulator